jgi:hypothetical protein
MLFFLVRLVQLLAHYSGWVSNMRRTLQYVVGIVAIGSCMTVYFLVTNSDQSVLHAGREGFTLAIVLPPVRLLFQARVRGGKKR